MNKTLQFIFGLVFAATGGIGTVVKILMATPDKDFGGNLSVLWAYALIVILIGGILLLQSAFKD